MNRDDVTAPSDKTGERDVVGRLTRTFDPTAYRIWIAQGYSITKRHLLWALVPLVTSLLSVVSIHQTLEISGVYVRPTLSFPGPIVDLWTIVAVPLDGVGSLLHSVLVATLPLSAVLTGLIAGAYLGSLDDLLDHERPSFRRNLVRYGVRLGLYSLLWDGASAAAIGVMILSLPLGIAAFVVYLLVTYRLWATPYLVVAADLSLSAALRRSWRLSAGGGPYRQFSLYFLATTLLLSIPRTYGVVTYAPTGLVVGALVLAPIAMTMSVASLGFVKSLVAESESDSV
ncbi:MAG: hypothetical protein ABEI57_04310 [Halapricum sp.]